MSCFGRWGDGSAINSACYVKMRLSVQKLELKPGRCGDMPVVLVSEIRDGIPRARQLATLTILKL